MHDIAGDDNLLLRLRGDDALARGHEQHLIAAVRVHLVARAGAEVDDAKIEILARLGRKQRLPCYRTAGEQGRVYRLSWDLARSVYLHGILLSGDRDYGVARGSLPVSRRPRNGAIADSRMGSRTSAAARRLACRSSDSQL